MWSTKRKASELDALLGRLRARQWKTEAERDEMLKAVAATEGLEPGDIAWLAVDNDVALRQAGLAFLKRHPYDEASAALFPHLASRTEAVRRQAMQALETLAGGNFIEKIQGFLANPDPVVVHAALDHLKKSPNERALPWIARVMAPANAPALRKKAFGIVEALSSPRSAGIALRALDDDDEEVRFRAIAVLAKHPDESHVGPLLKHCRNDSHRVQDAAIAALGPLLAKSQTWSDEVLPLLSDSNPKVRQLASKIIATQNPGHIADAFLRTFRQVYGPAKDRAVEALRELSPAFIRAFLDRAQSEDPQQNAMAASIAVTIRAPEAVPHCIRFLSGEDWWLRDRAALALAEIQDETALPHLLKMLQSPESSLSAAAALGTWGTPKALPGLLEAYKQADSHKDLRLEILDAFARIDDPRVGPLFLKIVQVDPDPLVKEKAARLSAARGAAVGAGTGSRTFAPVDFAATPRPSLSDLLRHARAVGASDLHLATGTAPLLRVHGRLAALPLPESSPEQMAAWLDPLLQDGRDKILETRRQIDFCHKDADLGRFRTNVFHQRKGPAAVMRLVPYEIPNLTDVGLPESIWEITTYSQGLILVTGPAGCGKTTTLAALVDRINETERGHIITVEDPIEYVHANKESLVNQREVPAHTRSFAKALRQSLREDPDVILVGEMRDLETISLAITASETGHLVLATLHTTTASSTVDRIINAFPPDQQGQIRQMVSDSLKAVISQSLLPRRDGTGRVAAFEILRNTPAVAGLIRDAKTFQIPTAMQTGSSLGMQLMDGALLGLVQDGTIDPRVAYDRASRKEAFEPFLPAEDGGRGVTAAPLPTPENRIDRFLEILPKRTGSDLHISVGCPPMVRIDGELERIRYRVLSEGDYYNLIGPITPPGLWESFQASGDVDYAYQMGKLARFRVNLFRQERGSAAVFRLIPSRVPTAEDLNLPAPIAGLYTARRGLILVTGPTGSGKSTTLAAVLDRMNKRLAHHVVTIEDPIEFVHTNDKSVFTQREIGPDVANFAEGVKAAIREDPDCLLVGEMRDLETMRMALTAAETGLLVFATVHTNSAAKAVDRIIDAFPAQEQEQVRIVLSEVLRGVVAQQLLRKKGGGRVPAFEILLGSTALSNSIREGKTALINNMIATGKSRGMISMDQSLAELLRGGIVEPDEALERAIDKESFKTTIASLGKKP